MSSNNSSESPRTTAGLTAQIRSLVRRTFEGRPGFVAAYLYGSALRDDYQPDCSDTDVLLIFEDSTEKQSLYDSIKGFVSEQRTVDVTIIFMSEFMQRVHPGWSR